MFFIKVREDRWVEVIKMELRPMTVELDKPWELISGVV